MKRVTPSFYIKGTRNNYLAVPDLLVYFVQNTSSSPRRTTIFSRNVVRANNTARRSSELMNIYWREELSARRLWQYIAVSEVRPAGPAAAARAAPRPSNVPTPASLLTKLNFMAVDPNTFGRRRHKVVVTAAIMESTIRT